MRLRGGGVRAKAREAKLGGHGASLQGEIGEVSFNLIEVSSGKFTEVTLSEEEAALLRDQLQCELERVQTMRERSKAPPCSGPPRTVFREGHDGGLACPHRDVSCCDRCRDAYEQIVDVYGVCYWIDDPAERASLKLGLDVAAHHIGERQT